MTLILLEECDCGKGHVVYFPYKTLVRKEINQEAKVPEELQKFLAVAEQMDNSEETLRELRLVKTLAEDNDYQFTNAGINDVIQCRCGKVVDILKILYNPWESDLIPETLKKQRGKG